MTVLVAYGSRMGGTEGIARAIAEALAQAGNSVDVRPAEAVEDLDDWEAAVIGSGLYAFRWTRPARRLVRRHADELRQMPVWFFSSGPLDDSASHGELPPTAAVRRLMELAGTGRHRTFGGRLPADAPGFVAQAMVKRGIAGDHRDLAAARAWGGDIAAELAALPPRPAAGRTHHRPWFTRLAAAFGAHA